MAVMKCLNKPFFGHHFTFGVSRLLVPDPPEELLDLRMTLTENRSHPRIESEGKLFGVMR
jgi:hypothetical protein